MKNIVYRNKKFTKSKNRIYQLLNITMILIALVVIGYYLVVLDNYFLLIIGFLLITVLAFNRGDWPVNYLEFDDNLKLVKVGFLKSFLFSQQDQILYSNLEFQVGYQKIQSSYKHYGYVIITDTTSRSIFGVKKHYGMQSGDLELTDFNEVIAKLLEVSVNSEKFKSKVRDKLTSSM